MAPSGYQKLATKISEKAAEMRMPLLPKDEGRTLHPTPPPARHTSKRADGISRSDFAATSWGEERSQAGKIPHKKGHGGGGSRRPPGPQEAVLNGTKWLK